MADKFLTREGLSALIKIIKQEIEQLKKIINNILVPTKTSDLINDSEFISDKNYVHTDNNYTASDKYKLDNIQFGAEVNVLSDWNVVDTNKDSYIKNKPTKVSQFDNDAGYLTQHQSLTSYATGVEYDSNNHLIYLLHNLDRISNPIDASDFIKDGMVTNVEVAVPSSGTNAGVRCLIITFNTDSGHTPIEIPLSLIAILPLVVTLTPYLENLFTPDRTFAEATAAYVDGRKVLFSITQEGVTLLVDVHWSLSINGSGMLTAMAYSPDVDGDIVTAFVWGSTSPYVIRAQNTLQPKLTAGSGITIDDNVISAPSAVPFVVTLSPDIDQQIVADKTFAEVYALLVAGNEVMFDLDGGYWKPMGFSDTVISASLAEAEYGGAVLGSLVWNKERGISFSFVNLQEKLTFDDEPTQASSNPVTSGGVFMALQSKADTTVLQNFCPIIEDTRTSAVANITGVAPFSSLVNGQMVVIHFNRVTYASSTLTLTLSDGTTTAAIPMKASYHNAGNYDINGDLRCNSGSYHLFVYNSTNNVWHTVGDIDYFTVYNGLTKAILDTGTSTVNCLVSAKLLRDNFYLKQEVDNLCPIIEDTRSSAVATITGVAPFATLQDGQRIVLHLAYNAPINSTLNLTNTTFGDVNIFFQLNSAIMRLSNGAFLAGGFYELIYDATNSRWVNFGHDFNTTYATMTQAEVDAGSSTATRLVTPKIIRDNFYLKQEVNNMCPIIEDTRTGVVTAITGVAPFASLVDGQRIVLHLNKNASQGSSTLNLTLSDNTTTGAKYIKIRLNGSFTILGNGYACLTNDYLPLVYNAYEDSWLMLGNEKNTTYAGMTQQRLDEGTSTGAYTISPQLLRDNFYLKSEVNNLCPIIEDTRSSAVATITGVAPFASLVDGQRIMLHFSIGSSANATLNLTLSNGTTTGAKAIKIASYRQTELNVGHQFYRANDYAEMVYDGGRDVWKVVGQLDTNSTYAAMTQAEIDAGTGTTARSITPKIIRDNFYLKQEVNNLCPIIEDTRSSAVAAITGVAPFDTLVDGLEILFHFAYSSYGTSSLTLTLSDNTTTAAIPMYVAIRSNGSAPLTSHLIQAGAYIPFKYIQSSNRWVSVGVVDTNDSYVALSTEELTTGTNTTSRTISAKVLRDNFYTETEVDTILTDYINAATYDSTTHKIYLKNDDTVLSEIDASDFIKDGMVNTVTIGNGTGANASVSCLIVSFNTDSGKENIEIPISNIFNADNYYTKSNVDTELAKYVTLATNLNITGEKMFVGAKRIKFKLSAASDKLGFTLYNNTNKELSYLEYNSGDLCLGSYYQLPGSQVKSRVGFKMSDVSSGVNAVYRILTPHAADAKTPFSLTNTTKDFYFPLGISNGTNLILTGSNGLLDISQMFTDYYTKTDIDNAGYLTTIPELTDSDFNEICV